MIRCSGSQAAFVRGYQLGNKLLVVVLNDQKHPETFSVESDLNLWLPSTKSYEVKYYDASPASY